MKKTGSSTGKIIMLIVVALLFLVGAAAAVLLALNEFTVTLSLNGDRSMALEYGQSFTDPGAQALAQGNILFRRGLDRSQEIQVDGTVDCAHLGDYVLTYRVDTLGCQAQVQRTVSVVDSVPPEIVLKEGETDPEGPYVEAGYTATDNYDGDITDRVVRVEELGKITYLVVDSAGNMAMAEREIPKFDSKAPELTLEGEAEIHMLAGTAYEEPGYTAMDEGAGDVTDRVTVSGEVICYTPGTYTLTYSVTDDYNNTAEATRQVVVEKQERPKVVIPEGKVVYLTFDDGPGPYTDQLLDVLKANDVKATFFVVGDHYGKTMQRIVDEGHSIGVHSITHNYQEIYASPEAYFADILGMQEIIYRNTGVRTTLMRFPGGSSNLVSSFNKGIMTYLTEAVQDAGFQYFDWNVDSNDAGGAKSADEVFDNVTDGISKHRTSVVLQHDIHPFSVKAVERIIQWGKAHGYTFLPLDPTSYGARHGVNN